ncbi:HlyD family efflux transporter periplasmic adaptor subunit [Bacillus mangrovi]|uniref:HlyD family efflux transporter periplasmic adaptor subunit n=1 Tax=Metabacillus mangrovi TaxID=1491830 RepID=A0A7X2V552_9BACI|nr:efflux RND transporter periplasmic adaptor subunit [Metabacillus mangrovi]MTH54447.1 HlyD family efflux transporter periplasmic adaptor subunit [Metabacillus mangrovi]
MSRGKLVLLNMAGIIVILALVAGGAYYYYQQTNFVTTDNAKVAGDLQTIKAPVAGKLSDFTLNEGDEVKEGAEIAKIQGGQNSQTITAPAEGTIIKKQMDNDQAVQPGQTIASEINLKDLYITANLKEDKIQDIEEGDDVDVTVDGDSGTVIEGKVEKIGLAANSIFSLMPKSNDDGNYTKVTQTIPVKISIENYSEQVLPGMNAEVKISKN